MISEAFGLTLVGVMAALSFGVLRAAVLRPSVLLALGIAGVFCVGYVAGHLSRPADGWQGAGQVRPASQWAGSADQTVTAVAPASTRGLNVKGGNKISIDRFDAASAGTPGNHDSVSVAKGTPLQIAGWAADSDAEAPCKALYFVIGKLRFDAPYGQARPDVAAYYHNPALAPTGFNTQIPTGGLAKGSYAVRVECLSADGKTLFTASRAPAVVIE